MLVFLELSQKMPTGTYPHILATCQWCSNTLIGMLCRDILGRVSVNMLASSCIKVHSGVALAISAF